MHEMPRPLGGAAIVNLCTPRAGHKGAGSPGESGSVAGLVGRPELGSDPHDLDHPRHRRADAPVDVELGATAPRVLEPEHDRPHARAVDELELREVEADGVALVAMLAQPLLDAVRDRDVQFAEQGDSDSTVVVDALSYFKGWPGECQL